MKSVVVAAKKQDPDADPQELVESLAASMAFLEMDTPLAFVAQINFADCKAFDYQGILPVKGMLYLFSTCEESALSAEPVAVVLYGAYRLGYRLV